MWLQCGIVTYSGPDYGHTDYRTADMQAELYIFCYASCLVDHFEQLAATAQIHDYVEIVRRLLQ